MKQVPRPGDEMGSPPTTGTAPVLPPSTPWYKKHAVVVLLIVGTLLALIAFAHGVRHG
jgi:hypothetical protein